MSKFKALRETVLAGLLILITSILYGQDVPQKEETMTASDYLKEGDELFKKRDYEKARLSYTSSLQASEKAGQTSEKAEALAQIARTYLATGDKDQARVWLEKAKGAARPDDPPGWSRYLGVRGRLEWKENSLVKATATFIEMYEFCHNHKLRERAVDAANMVVITGNSEQQIEWGKKGIAEAEAGEVTSHLGPLWNNLGFTYESLKRYGESLEAYQKAREYHGKYGDERNRLIADWAVGHAFRLKGDLDSAETWIASLPAWCEKIREEEFLGWSHKELGEIAAVRGHEDLAKKHFEIALSNLEKSGMADWDPQGFAELKTKAGRPDSAATGQK